LGCLKLTYREETQLKVISGEKGLTSKKSTFKGGGSYLFGFNGKEKDEETGWYGSGNDAAWSQQGNCNSSSCFEVGTGSLIYSNLFTQGNKIVGRGTYNTVGRLFDFSNGGELNALLTSSLYGNPQVEPKAIGKIGTTVWLSFLLKKNNANTQPVYVALGKQTGNAWHQNDAPIRIGYFGGSNNSWQLSLRQTDGNYLNVPNAISAPVVAGQTEFFVLRIDYNGSNTRLRLYRNPTLLGEELPDTSPIADQTVSTQAVSNPPSPVVQNVMQFRSIAYYSGHSGQAESELDEIRLGTSYANVSPTIPTGDRNAEILSLSDYYPFGSVMPGRQFVRDAYRYGFNGKEKDAETGDYDYGFRMYKPSIGRFMSVDPLTSEYPFYSPYHFAGNSPIANVDVDGLEPASVVQWDKNNKAYILTENAANLLSEITGIDYALIKKTKIRSHNSNYGMTFYQKINLPASFFAGGEDDNEMSWVALLSHEVGHLPQAQKFGNDLTYSIWQISHYARSAFLYDWQNPNSKVIHDASLPEQEAEEGYNKYREWKKNYDNPKKEINRRLNEDSKKRKSESKPKDKPKDKPTDKSTPKRKNDPYKRYNDKKGGGGIKNKYKGKN
jgi:RHS repeat-associated protein